jgi:hypothetical protein
MMKGREGRFFLSCFVFVSFIWGVEWGEGEPWGASKGDLDHEDRIRISYVPHRPSRPPIGHDLKQNKTIYRSPFDIVSHQPPLERYFEPYSSASVITIPSVLVKILVIKVFGGADCMFGEGARDIW